MRHLSRFSPKYQAGRIWPAYLLVGALWFVMGSAYKAKMPSDLTDICTIFDDRRDWYAAAQESENRWGTPTHIQMAIIGQESSFRYNAKPPRTTLMGIIPWSRPSNAYGFAQALDGTWEQYQGATNRPYADRDDFEDAIDFVGWYTHQSKKIAGISKWDPYNQYLAYHEGQTGWKNGSYRQKEWLKKAAKKVDARARNWSTQLQRCEDDLNDRWWVFGD